MTRVIWFGLCLMLGMPAFAWAQEEKSDEAQELAKKLANPVANLISVPFQNNVDFSRDGGVRNLLNFQPVIPISLNEDWNLITRNIVPVIGMNSSFSPDGHSAFGLGDITSSYFFSPKAPTSGGWIWGVGPAALIPTATDRVLGQGKFGLGPTVVVLRQDSGWTYGVLANQIWSVAGPNGRQSVNASFVQPFVSYAWHGGFSVTGNSESTFNWADGGRPTIPFNLIAQQIVKVGEVPVQFFGGARVYADRPSGGPNWGLRFGFVLLFPK